jgi:hypothetical protein
MEREGVEGMIKISVNGSIVLVPSSWLMSSPSNIIHGSWQDSMFCFGTVDAVLSIHGFDNVSYIFYF